MHRTGIFQPSIHSFIQQVFTEHQEWFQVLYRVPKSCKIILLFRFSQDKTWASQLVVKNPLASEGDGRDAGLIPGSERSPRVGNGNPLQYSYLGNPMHRGAWRAIVHGVAKSQTRLKRLGMHTCSRVYMCDLFHLLLEPLHQRHPTFKSKILSQQIF